MKTKIRILTILAFVFAAAIGVNAGETPKMNVVALDDSRALVAVEQNVPATSVFSITTEDGQVVYYKETKKAHAGFKSVFDLSALTDGNYTVKFKTGTTTVNRELSIDNGDIDVAPAKTEYAPVFALDGDMLKVSYFNAGQNALDLKVYKGSGIVFNTDLGNDVAIQQGIDLSNLEKGTYDIALTSAGESYWFSVKR